MKFLCMTHYFFIDFSTLQCFANGSTMFWDWVKTHWKNFNFCYNWRTPGRRVWFRNWPFLLTPVALTLSIAMPFFVHWCIDYSMRPWFLRKNSDWDHEFILHTCTFLLNPSHRSLILHRKVGNTSRKHMVQDLW